jgi:hypothetical protein
MPIFLPVEQHRQLHRNRDAAEVALAEDRLQVGALDVLHREEVGPVEVSVVEDLDEVHVLEAGRDLRLVLEHLDELGVAVELRQDALDDDDLLDAAEHLDLGLVDLGHAARGDALDELVPPVKPGLVVVGLRVFFSHPTEGDRNTRTVRVVRHASRAPLM